MLVVLRESVWNASEGDYSLSISTINFTSRVTGGERRQQMVEFEESELEFASVHAVGVRPSSHTGTLGDEHTVNRWSGDIKNDTIV